ncbi:MAG: hypothetical protein KAH18_01495 [Psychromonas sp.]|nr:hypothetical protein [Psychromonas sp.]
MYSGSKEHLLIDYQGSIVNFTLTKTSDSERMAVWELLKVKNHNYLLGDKGYLSALVKSNLDGEQ